MTRQDTPGVRRLNFRPPTSSPSGEDNGHGYTVPSIEFMTGPWQVTHSTLPMWKSNMNVVITYTPLESSPGSWDNLVTYNPLGSSKKKTVRGIETPDAKVPGMYKWRGKGLLMIASSVWEVLGWGEDDGGWIVTFFRKTLFTPAGVDICARRKGGLSKGLQERIKSSISEVGEKAGDDKFAKLIGDVFEVKHE